ncbi:MAG: hypothetical protein IJ200_12845 [Prevotella sp.]|nr:hypothetical protein [Prevotella sp.]
MSRIEEIEREFEQMFEEANGDLDVLDRLTKERLKKIQTENREWERQFKILMGFQNGGAELERKNRLEDAVAEYRKAVDYGKNSDLFQINNYYHSYERLAVLYRKLKMYAKEVGIIREALSEELQSKERNKMLNRLEKSKKLLGI